MTMTNRDNQTDLKIEIEIGVFIAIPKLTLNKEIKRRRKTLSNGVSQSIAMDLILSWTNERSNYAKN